MLKQFEPPVVQPIENVPPGIFFIVIWLMALSAPGRTARDTVQLCPPKLILKFAVPATGVVPVRTYCRLPGPSDSVPAAKEAVRPVRPVEETVCDVYKPPFPPVYGMLIVVPSGDIPATRSLLKVAPAQLSPPTIPAEGVVKLCWPPYTIPALFIANPRHL